MQFHSGRVLIFFTFLFLLQGCSLSKDIFESKPQIPFRKTGTVKPSGSMHYGRIAPKAIKLRNGNVLLINGVSINANDFSVSKVAALELFNPNHNTFKVVGQIKRSKFDEINAVLLNNGEVFIIISDYLTDKTGVKGSFRKSRTFLYKPSKNKLFSTSSLSFEPAISTPISSPLLFAYGEKEVLLFEKRFPKNGKQPFYYYQIFDPANNKLSGFKRLNIKNPEELIRFGENWLLPTYNTKNLPLNYKDPDREGQVYLFNNDFSKRTVLGYLSYSHAPDKSFLLGKRYLIVSGKHYYGSLLKDFSHNDLEVFDIRQRKSLGKMHYSNFKKGHFLIESVGEDKILLFGGKDLTNNSTLNEIQLCHAVKLKCTTINHLPFLIEGFSTVHLNDSSYLIIGGGYSETKVDSITLNNKPYNRYAAKSRLVKDAYRFYLN